jgi:hypothetical protein
MEKKFYEEESRKHWYLETDASLPQDKVQLGAILRIADAAEAMAKNYNDLVKERDNYKQWYEEAHARNQKLYRTIYALKAWITRWKKKATR